MSEYQYYEFQTIDRPLTVEQQVLLRGLSRRAEVSTTRAVFNYSYGDFPAEPIELLAEHFDAFFYIANWGTKHLAFRFPRAAVDLDQFRPYTYTDADEMTIVDVDHVDMYVILSMKIHDEDGFGWIEGDGMLDPLIPLRNDIMQGDLRALYLVWLAAVSRTVGEGNATPQAADDEAEAETLGSDERRITDSNVLEPRVPPGLNELNAALVSLVEFLALDKDLLAAAATASPPQTLGEEPLERWVTLLPDAERNTFLVRLARGEPGIGVTLLRRLRSLGNPTMSEVSAATPRRSLAALRKAAAQLQQLRTQREYAEAERLRLARLDTLAKREPEVWRQIAQALAKRNAAGYDEAIRHLVELRGLAIQRKQPEAFKALMEKVLAPYMSSAAVQRRLKEQQFLD